MIAVEGWKSLLPVLSVFVKCAAAAVLSEDMDMVTACIPLLGSQWVTALGSAVDTAVCCDSVVGQLCWDHKRNCRPRAFRSPVCSEL